MPSRQAEQNANNALGALLERMLPACAIRVENTRVIVGQSGLRLDILITAPDRAPVVVEAEFMPAADAEQEAKDRLGLEVADGRRPIEAAIALRYPEGLEFSGSVNEAMPDARLEYAVFHSDQTRFPESGWLAGAPEDLAELVRLVSVPQEAVNSAADALQDGIESAVAILDDMAILRPAITREISDRLGMSDGAQTRRMACAIIANAMVFHEQISGMHDEVKPLNLVCGDDIEDPKEETLSAWKTILDINYYSIFGIAQLILEQIPSADAARILRSLRLTAQRVDAAGVTNAHDLTGRIFQRLIADRKYLATFYTLPASAALLARLAVAKMNVDWSDADAISGLRMGDFACGTGALLSAVYEQIAVRHENSGGDAAALHPAMMEEVLYGCDVMPSAIHITGSTLSGMRPNVGFGRTRLYPMPYGRQDDGTVKIGSLELLQSSSVVPLFETSDPSYRLGSAGEIEAQAIAEIPDESFDLAIMNPPFTRNVTREGAYAGTVNAAFAAFDANEADQRQMAKQMAVFTRNTCYHGNAGIASAFAALGHRKLRPGGILALVLPLAATGGLAWQKLRRMLGEHYTDLMVLSIAANGRDMSFSSDTGMAECLIIARKLRMKKDSTSRGHFISLADRPQGFVEARSVAQAILSNDQVRQIEDGPYGGRSLTIGDEPVGEMISSPVSENGASWNAVRISDYSLSQSAFALSESKLWLPGRATFDDIRIRPLSEVGKLGMYHLDIIGRPPRGPFDKATPSPTATYPALWNHNAKNETRMVCAPDSQLRVRQGMEEKAAEVWATASRSHLNLEYTFGSQPLAIAFTEQESIGGRVWPNVIFDDNRFDYAFAVWGNCTLGLLCYWWHSTRQQSSKASITIRSAESLPTLDLHALTDTQLATAQDIFNEFRDKQLKPAYISDADPTRALLDKRVICDLLGFDQDTYAAVRRLSAKWSAEPSVHGGKPRPRGARVIY